MTSVRVCLDRHEWDTHVDACGGHPLQLWGWGEVKAKHGWSAQRLLVVDGAGVIGGMQLLDRSLKLPKQAVRYAPRGPFWIEGRGDEVIDVLASYVKAQRRGTVLMLEPDSEQLPHAERFRPSAMPILMKETLVIDLGSGEEAFLAGMAKKTRYYVRKASKNPDLEYRRVTDEAEIRRVLAVYRETADRANFGIHSDDYYLDIASAYGVRSCLLAAYADNEPCAFLWDVFSTTTSLDLYGGSTTRGQELFANYGLKLAMAHELIAAGVTRYDLNGLLGDGVSSFKKGFAGHTTTLAGSFDLPLSLLYRGYNAGLPVAMKTMHAFRR
ncbi:MAG: lipid II:glycine glycyltransferase FemX [Propionibacteriaceae bacterium]